MNNKYVPMQSSVLVFLLSMFITNFGLTNKYLVVTVPKSGTHLIKICISSLFKQVGKPLKLVWTIPGNLQHANAHKPLQENKVDMVYEEYWKTDPIGYFNHLENMFKHEESLCILGHVIFDRSLVEELSKRGYKVFLNIRDPRDQIISTVHWIKKLIPGIQESTSTLIPHYFLSSSLPMSLGVDGFYFMLKWLDYPDVMLTRFETLVGPRGGGSQEKQYKEIEAIAQRLGLSISNKQIEKIAHDLFGGTETFRQGLIGAWKTEFTKEHKELFKQIPGANQLLMQLGYEENEDW